ncbi:MAG: phosphatidylglycerophosphatase A [bacterium]|nr:MAG: phosphatidylglycerophosphatase A [bacterium]
MSTSGRPAADRFVVVLATGFGAGYSPVASGTAGSIVGVALFLLINGWSWPAYMAFTVIIFAVGVIVSTRAEAIFGEKDSGKIVIDEIAGQLVALFTVPLTVYTVCGGFLLFRLFDITKPFFRPLEKLKGGMGVMIDDLAAGLLALAVLKTLLLIFY